MDAEDHGYFGYLVSPHDDIALKLDTIADWGSVLGLTYIAAQRVFPDYNEMADAKALLESIGRSFGFIISAYIRKSE